jgi:hypothetical protein
LFPVLGAPAIHEQALSGGALISTRFPTISSSVTKRHPSITNWGSEAAHSGLYAKHFPTEASYLAAKAHMDALSHGMSVTAHNPTPTEAIWVWPEFSYYGVSPAVIGMLPKSLAFLG